MGTGLLVAGLLAAACLLYSVPHRGPGTLVLQRSARDDPRPGIADAPLMLDLTGAILAAGAPVAHALEILAASCDPVVAARLRRVKDALDLGAEWESAWETAGPGAARGRRDCVDDLRETLRFAAGTGAPSAAIIHACAAQLRRRRNREVERKAAALGVKLVVPLGLCALPSFVCLGVLPVVWALLPSL
ncbi:type II secretion system F family protein [Arthrobacter sp. Br18]|uniref:type II secretion system F family protein n=1 Tax=Arthrobacter sp. Br18 TaxID=1312954 RepID=UPI00055C9D3F|nr:type II secretion system F family protein [Arthrobacter sp. Br18]